MKCPNIEEIESNKDNQYQLARWYRFCDVETVDEMYAIKLIMQYFKGFTSQLSKQVGWEE